jgi:PhzF family phenazine biosynthesis protein
MRSKLYQIDAFASKVFEGNPAAVCPLETWLDETTMQRIAMENDLSETAFFVKAGDHYAIRWFTPTHEVDLCGHATLASAYVIFEYLDPTSVKIVFDSKSGPLQVSKEAEMLTMEFPVLPIERCDSPPEISAAFSPKAIEVFKGMDYIVVFDDDVDLTTVTPDLEILKRLDLRGVCITTRDQHYDFVSRFFAPNYGIDEDSVTGSAYTQLMPYWAKRLGRTTLTSKQVSARGGELRCTLQGERVLISGQAVVYLTGKIEV